MSLIFLLCAGLMVGFYVSPRRMVFVLTGAAFLVAQIAHIASALAAQDVSRASYLPLLVGMLFIGSAWVGAKLRAWRAVA